MTTGADIGSWVHISSHVSIIGGMDGVFEMGDFTTIATGCRIVCVTDDFSGGTGLLNPFVLEKYQSHHYGDRVVMRRYSALGTNVVVHPGVVIGEGSVVGSNSLVIEDTEPWTVNIGTPTEKIGVRPRDKILKYTKEIYASDPSFDTIYNIS